MNRFFSRLIPFLFLGTGIVLLVAGLVVLSYLLIAGAIVGLILFAVAVLREWFFDPAKRKSKKRTGKTIDHDSL